MSDDLKNVYPIKYTGPSVDEVLEDFSGHVENLRAVYIVGITQDEGEILCWGSGHLEHIATAALAIADLARVKLQGNMSHEEP